jgi:hypothetical protein
LNVGEDKGLAGFEPAPVIVLAGGISGGDAVGLEVVKRGQIVQGEILRLSKQTSAEKDGQCDA